MPFKLLSAVNPGCQASGGRGSARQHAQRCARGLEDGHGWRCAHAQPAGRLPAAPAVHGAICSQHDPPHAAGAALVALHAQAVAPSRRQQRLTRLCARPERGAPGQADAPAVCAPQPGPGSVIRGKPGPAVVPAPPSHLARHHVRLGSAPVCAPRQLTPAPGCGLCLCCAAQS